MVLARHVINQQNWPVPSDPTEIPGLSGSLSLSEPAPVAFTLQLEVRRGTGSRQIRFDLEVDGAVVDSTPFYAVPAVGQVVYGPLIHVLSAELAAGPHLYRVLADIDLSPPSTTVTGDRCRMIVER